MRIGRSTGIGRYPGIGRSILANSNSFLVDCLIIKLNNISTPFTMDMRIFLSYTKTFTCDAHILTGTYLKTFTFDCELISGKPFTMDMWLSKIWTDKIFTCDMRIATTKITEQFDMDVTIADRNTEVFYVDAYIIAMEKQKTFTSDMHISTERDKEFTTDTHIAQLDVTDTFTCDAHILLTHTATAFTTDIDIANFKTQEFSMDNILFKYPVYQLNGCNITNHIKQPDISGLTKKLNKYTAPYQLISTIIDMGTESLSYSFELRFTNIGDYDEFLTAVNSDTRDIIFYPGRDDVYHKIKSVSVKPTYIFHGIEYRTQVTLDLEDPYLYSVHSYEHKMGTVASGFTTNEFRNEGSVNSPYEKIEITGIYSGGNHLTNSVIYIMDGVIEESHIPISDLLLTNEVASLDVYGKMTCTYSDDYTSSTKFDQDVYQSSLATCSGGKIRILAGGYMTYKFYGPHPTLYNIGFNSNMNKVSGSPIVQVSTDNSTWETAIRSDQIVNNIDTEYYINGSEKLGDLYVRFYCPTGAILDVFDVEFIADRDATYYNIPSIPPWESRTLKIIGNGSGIAGIDCLFRARKWP